MSTTPTTNYGWQKPVSGTEIDTWGVILNSLFDAVDAKMKEVADAAAAAIPAAAPTGSVMDFFLNAAPSGWLELAGQTVGSASSGAAYANAAAQNLFTAMWNSHDNSICAVSGGRGASAAADWAANKQLTLIDQRDRFRRSYKSGGDSAAIGVQQADQMQQITGNIGKVINHGGATVDGAFTSGSSENEYAGGTGPIVQVAFDSANSSGARTGTTTRPVNIAYLTCIKL